MSCPRKSSLLCLLVGTLTASAGCAPYTFQGDFTATDGSVLHSPVVEVQNGYGNLSDQSLKASGAHDLPCPKEQVTSSIEGNADIYATTGCGFRTVYRLVDGPLGTVVGHAIHDDKHFVLLSRSPLTPSPSAASAPSPP